MSAAHRPRPYQTAALDAIDRSFERVDRSLLVLPTGCGKTAVFTWLIERFRDRGLVSPTRPALIIADREELLQQAYDRVAAMDDMLRIGLERAASTAPIGSEVIVASVQTLGRENSRRLPGVQPGLIVIDEAHKSAAKSYHILLRRFGAHRGECKVLGCTATPKRLDKQALHSEDGAVYQEVAYSYSIREAIRDGYLCDIHGYRVQTDTNLNLVSVSGGDFSDAELQKAVDTDARTHAAIDRWLEVARDRRTIVFCAGVAHARHAAEAWRDAGVEAMHVDGTMDRNYRGNIMRDFKAGKIQVLTNCEIATTGFDCPEVSCITHLRPTKSWTLYMQMTGRGTRICEGKENLVVLDVVDNYFCKKGGLATVPAILDLPPSLDLEGASLETAAKAMDELKAAGAGTLLEQVAGDALKAPRTLAEVRSLMERVDLLSGIEPGPEVLAASKFAWLAQPGGGYVLDVGKTGQAALFQDALGVYHVQFRSERGVTQPRRLSDDLVAALQHCDKRLVEKFPDVGKLCDTKAWWRKKPPHDKQLKMVAALGGDVQMAKKMPTAGQVSGYITQLEKRKSQRTSQRQEAA